ncbi:hypothetical protein CIHG_06688 [Coccidioides immitis H538.4]|uniref:Uncharacterized protein n=2 Tax=Coccidioides immitis TaxID=5501 RepID=A0A0J8RVP7_COCIT|nr:hypothetical protein CIRG_01579 [Coccidioides immitis RMSCC 2394]KMU88887.1 hypothetical protein CIHG_06688 [Coccidioides immitis H538.4]
MRLRMNDPAHPTAHASPTRCQRKKGIMKANASGSQGFQTPLHVDQPCHIDAGASGEPENGSPAPLQSSPVRAAWHGADAGTANWDCGLSALSPTRAERGCLCASLVSCLYKVEAISIQIPSHKIGPTVQAVDRWISPWARRTKFWAEEDPVYAGKVAERLVIVG